MGDPGTFTSELVLRRGWWRQFPQEVVVMAWSAGTLAASWTVSAGRVPDSYRAYVELLPLAPDRVEGAPSRADQRVGILDRSPEDVRMVWLELTGVGRTAAEAADWIRARRPGLTVVDSLGGQSARTE